jgi:hypothetical protein
MRQIADWLKKLGLDEYTQRFAENAIDVSVLPDLTDQDLEKLGVLLGHRRKMLRAIAELKADVLADAVLFEPTPQEDIEHITDVVLKSSLSLEDLSPNIWATECLRISVTRKRMKRMPSGLCARAWH